MWKFYIIKKLHFKRFAMFYMMYRQITLQGCNIYKEIKNIVMTALHVEKSDVLGWKVLWNSA